MCIHSQRRFVLNKPWFICVIWRHLDNGLDHGIKSHSTNEVCSKTMVYMSSDANITNCSEGWFVISQTIVWFTNLLCEFGPIMYNNCYDFGSFTSCRRRWVYDDGRWQGGCDCVSGRAGGAPTTSWTSGCICQRCKKTIPFLFYSYGIALFRNTYMAASCLLIEPGGISVPDTRETLLSTHISYGVRALVACAQNCVSRAAIFFPAHV